MARRRYACACALDSTARDFAARVSRHASQAAALLFRRGCSVAAVPFLAAIRYALLRGCVCTKLGAACCVSEGLSCIPYTPDSNQKSDFCIIVVFKWDVKALSCAAKPRGVGGEEVLN